MMGRGQDRAGARTHLAHGVGKEGLQSAALQVGFILQAVEEGGEV